MYLIDTVICIQILNNNQAIIERLRELDGLSTLSVINAGELIYGAYKSDYITENISSVQNLLELMGEVYEIDAETIWIYGRLKAEILRRFGPKDKQKQRKFRLESLGFFDNDLWIASIAIQHELTLITQDNDFKQLQGFEGLKLMMWC
jgi:tRNA(fMet)-specific endonuclease VapC